MLFLHGSWIVNFDFVYSLRHIKLLRRLGRRIIILGPPFITTWNELQLAILCISISLDSRTRQVSEKSIIYIHIPLHFMYQHKSSSPCNQSSTPLKVKGVGIDVDSIDLKGLVILSVQASRIGVVEAKGAGEGRVGGVQDDGSVDVLCSN